MSDSIDNILSKLAKSLELTSNIPDSDTQLGKEAYDIELVKSVIHDGAQNRAERKLYAKWLFILVCAWLAVILSIVVLQGFGILCLSDSVLITLITTTTLNVLVLFGIVIRYLFKSTLKKLP